MEDVLRGFTAKLFLILAIGYIVIETLYVIFSYIVSVLLPNPPLLVFVLLCKYIGYLYISLYIFSKYIGELIMEYSRASYNVSLDYKSVMRGVLVLFTCIIVFLIVLFVFILGTNTISYPLILVLVILILISDLYVKVYYVLYPAMIVHLSINPINRNSPCRCILCVLDSISLSIDVLDRYLGRIVRFLVVGAIFGFFVSLIVSGFVGFMLGPFNLPLTIIHPGMLNISLADVMVRHMKKISDLFGDYTGLLIMLYFIRDYVEAFITGSS